MKAITILTAVLFSSLMSFAQFTIPNGDFEEWVFNGWNFSPNDWQTGNTQTFQDTFQDTVAYEGDFAMRVQPQPTGVGEEGEASVTIPTQAIPSSLDFYVRYERTLTAFMGVTIEFYNEENMFYSETWSAPDSVSEWSFVSMPLNQIEPVMTHAIIRVQAFVGDLVAGDGWIAVDAMSIGGEVDGVSEDVLSQVSVYPNPASDYLMIDLGEMSEAIDKIRMIDIRGRAIDMERSSKQIDLSAMQNGLYILEFLDQGGEVIGSRRVVVE